ncbi:hypothetical protein L218DRAFT_998889 [Marasmius fiardii PR-910]|nr:hypothetical protein L218DRAFT_998889 [Marasmius fiardii PR-910]
MNTHVRVFRLGYLFLPAPEEGVASLNPLRECLRFDPHNKVYLSLHRQAKKSIITRNKVHCLELLEMDNCAEDVDGLVGKAQFLMTFDEDSDVEEVVRLLEKAFKARKGLLAEMRTRRRSRRLSGKQPHPDEGSTEQKMAAANEAYEVLSLSNPELRARFDAGDEPSGGAGGPFAYTYSGGHGGFGGLPNGDHASAQFFQQGGGGGQGFKFHFSH